MYKKITHTIVEEHFDHPMGEQIKKKLERSRIPNNEIFLESKFRADVFDYFSTYASSINEMINSVNRTEENLITTFENMFKNNWIDELGNMTKPFYQSDFSEVINLAMRQLALTALSIVQQVKLGNETRFLIDSYHNLSAGQIAGVMTSANYSWRFNPIRDMFIGIVENILAQTTARWEKDSVAEESAKAELARLFSFFETLFANGIITQFPDRFTMSSAGPATTSNNKDIM